MTNTKKIRTFLSNLATEEVRYLELQLSLAKDARTIMNEFDLSISEFCLMMNLDERIEFDLFIKGGFNYTIMDMAKLQNIWLRQREIQAKKETEKYLTNTNTEINNNPVVEEHKNLIGNWENHLKQETELRCILVLPNDKLTLNKIYNLVGINRFNDEENKISSIEIFNDKGEITRINIKTKQFIIE